MGFPLITFVKDTSTRKFHLEDSSSHPKDDHPMVSRALYRFIESPCVGDPRSTFHHSRKVYPHRSLLLRVIYPAHRHLSLAILRAMSATLVHLWKSLFLNRSGSVTSSITLSIRLHSRVTFSLFMLPIVSKNNNNNP